MDSVAEACEAAAEAVEDVGDNIMKLLLPLLAAFTLSAQVKTFDTPDAAAQAVIAAAEKNDVAALTAIFGANSKAILTSGDPKQDAEERAEFARVARAKYHIEKDPMNRHRVLIDIGPEDWPFPVPLVEKGGKWSFEPAQGELEVRARRIGANEIDAMDTCAGLVQAQVEYADAHKEYAEFLSLSNSIPKALAEAEVRPGKTKTVPYHGYYFHVLTSSQASPERGGVHNYMMKDRHMMGGFAIVAWPAQYGVTGIHTFIVDQQGIIYKKDLGAPASNLAPPVRAFAPDKTWSRVDQ